MLSGWLYIGVSEGLAGKVSSVLGRCWQLGSQDKMEALVYPSFPEPGQWLQQAPGFKWVAIHFVSYLQLWQCWGRSLLGGSAGGGEHWVRPSWPGACRADSAFLAFGGLFLHGPGSFLVPEDLVWVGWRSHG